MGSKEPIPKMILFINGYSIRELIYQKILGLYTGWNHYFTTLENFWVFSGKGDPWGDLNAPEATSGHQLPLFSAEKYKSC